MTSSQHCNWFQLEEEGTCTNNRHANTSIPFHFSRPSLPLQTLLSLSHPVTKSPTMVITNAVSLPARFQALTKVCAVSVYVPRHLVATTMDLILLISIRQVGTAIRKQTYGRSHLDLSSRVFGSTHGHELVDSLLYH